MSVWEAAGSARLSRVVFCDLTRMMYSLESLYPCIMYNLSAAGLMTSMKMTFPWQSGINALSTLVVAPNRKEFLVK